VAWSPAHAPCRVRSSSRSIVVCAPLCACIVLHHQLERVLLARSGTLLLTWLDPTGAVAAVRSAMKAAFPGACSRQASIIHTSLARVAALPPSRRTAAREHVVQSVSAECELLTQQLRRLVLPVQVLHWVNEQQFSTVRGPSLALALQSPPPADM
jgi:hypothetical protein